MILSHKYKFIFLKTKKTAGTSIEIALSRYCGPEDIITPISPQDEALRSEYGVGPQNLAYRWKRPGEIEIKHFKKLLKGKNRFRKEIYYNHMSAAELTAVVEPHVWDSYFKFCFVRNPWDRFVSRHAWEGAKKGQAVDMDGLIRNSRVEENIDIYTLDGKVAVDKVCRYESLQEDLNLVCSQLGIPFDGVLPRAKGGHREKKHYSDILSPEQAAEIARRCKEEIEWFGYSF